MSLRLADKLLVARSALTSFAISAMKLKKKKYKNNLKETLKTKPNNW
jgi:hypothetical protein